MTNAIHIRRATPDDARLLFEWRNDPETRRASRTTEPLVWETHVRWLADSLKNSHRILGIAEMEGTPIGTMRADERKDGYTEISYTVAPTFRGKGFGTSMVVQFVKEYLSGKELAATIKKGHAPSESLARALGLSPHHETPSGDPEDLRPNVEWR